MKGVVWTIVNFIIIYNLTLLVSENDYISLDHGDDVLKQGDIVRLPKTDILVFSAVLCSTDTVAALVLFPLTLDADKQRQKTNFI